MSLTLASPLETLVPPARLASLLVGARTQSGVELAALEFAAKGRFSIGDLRQIEAGSVALSDNELRAIARLYNIDLATIAPGRSTLEIDRSEGLLIVGGTTKKFLPDDDDRKIMLRYLALVYKMRDTKPGTPIGPRDNDLSLLASVFGCTESDIRVQFEHLTTSAVREIESMHGTLGWRKILPGIGVLVALTGVGALLLTQTNHHAPLRPSTNSIVRAHINIDEPLVITNDGGATASSIRINIGDPTTITAKRIQAAHTQIQIGDPTTITR